MKIMKNHADLLQEIEIIKNQIEQYEMSVNYWFGQSTIPMMNAEGAQKFGLGIASENIDRIHRKINALQRMLEAFEFTRDENEKRINQLEGLGYKIARLRFVEGMTYKEIAEELNYSHSHIRRVAAETNRLEKVV